MCLPPTKDMSPSPLSWYTGIPLSSAADSIPSEHKKWDIEILNSNEALYSQLVLTCSWLRTIRYGWVSAQTLLYQEYKFYGLNEKFKNLTMWPLYYLAGLFPVSQTRGFIRARGRVWGWGQCTLCANCLMERYMIKVDSFIWSHCVTKTLRLPTLGELSKLKGRLEYRFLHEPWCTKTRSCWMSVANSAYVMLILAEIIFHPMFHNYVPSV